LKNWCADAELKAQLETFFAEVVLHWLRFVTVFKFRFDELFAALAVGFLVPNELC